VVRSTQTDYFDPQYHAYVVIPKSTYSVLPYEEFQFHNTFIMNRSFDAADQRQLVTLPFIISWTKYFPDFLLTLTFDIHFKMIEIQLIHDTSGEDKDGSDFVSRIQ